MKKTLTLTLIILLSLSVFSLDLKITSIELPSSPVIKSNEVILNVSLISDENSSFSLVGVTDSNVFFETNQVLDANVEKVISVPFTPNNVGTSVLDFNAFNESDTNQSNNLKTVSFEVFNGVNLVASDLVLSNTNPKAGDSININAIVNNVGDLNSSFFTSCVVFLGSNIECWDNSLVVGEEKTHTFSWSVPSDLVNGNTLQLIVDVNSTQTEFDETDNNYTAGFSVSEITDFFISGDSIRTNGNTFYPNETISFTADVQNIGGIDASNVLVRAWHTTKVDDNLIYSNTMDLASGETKQVNFNFTPLSEGTVIVFVEIDPLNDFNENNELNNNAEKSIQVVVKPVDENQLDDYSHTIIAELKSNCEILFSNGDLLVGKKLEKSGENSFIDFELRDLHGNILIQDTAGYDYEKGINGRTIKALTINSVVARFLFIFQAPLTIVYDTCKTDIEHISEDAEATHESLTECQKSLSEMESKYTSLSDLYESSKKTFEGCGTNLNSCEADKLNLTNQIASSNSNCDSRIAVEIQKEKNNCELRIQALDVNRNGLVDEKNKLQLERDIAIFGFSFVLLIIGASLILWRLKKDNVV